MLRQASSNKIKLELLQHQVMEQDHELSTIPSRAQVPVCHDIEEKPDLVGCYSKVNLYFILLPQLDIIRLRCLLFRCFDVDAVTRQSYSRRAPQCFIK
jgi:hypothetical protein